MKKGKVYLKKVININEVLLGGSILLVVLYFHFYPLFNYEKYDISIEIILFINGIILVVFNTNFINLKNNYKKLSIFIITIIEAYSINKIFYYFNINSIIYFKILLVLLAIVLIYILFLIISKFIFISNFMYQNMMYNSFIEGVILNPRLKLISIYFFKLIILLEDIIFIVDFFITNI